MTCDLLTINFPLPFFFRWVSCISDIIILMNPAQMCILIVNERTSPAQNNLEMMM